jgi:hypothetical protein
LKIFGCQSFGDQKKFNHHTIGDRMLSVTKLVGNQKHSVANHVKIDFFFNCCMILDLGHLIDNGLISTIDLATKFGWLGNKM